MRESEVLTRRSTYKAIMVTSASSLRILFVTLMWMGGNCPKATKQLGKHIAKKLKVFNKEDCKSNLGFGVNFNQRKPCILNLHEYPSMYT